jgi:hypothetical protein
MTGSLLHLAQDIRNTIRRAEHIRDVKETRVRVVGVEDVPVIEDLSNVVGQAAILTHTTAAYATTVLATVAGFVSATGAYIKSNLARHADWDLLAVSQLLVFDVSNEATVTLGSFLGSVEPTDQFNPFHRLVIERRLHNTVTLTRIFVLMIPIEVSILLEGVVGRLTRVSCKAVTITVRAVVLGRTYSNQMDGGLAGSKLDAVKHICNLVPRTFDKRREVVTLQPMTGHLDHLGGWLVEVPPTRLEYLNHAHLS